MCRPFVGFGSGLQSGQLGALWACSLVRSHWHNAPNAHKYTGTVYGCHVWVFVCTLLRSPFYAPPPPHSYGANVTGHRERERESKRAPLRQRARANAARARAFGASRPDSFWLETVRTVSRLDCFVRVVRAISLCRKISNRFSQVRSNALTHRQTHTQTHIHSEHTYPNNGQWCACLQVWALPLPLPLLCRVRACVCVHPGFRTPYPLTPTPTPKPPAKHAFRWPVR